MPILVWFSSKIKCIVPFIRSVYRSFLSATCPSKFNLSIHYNVPPLRGETPAVGETNPLLKQSKSSTLKFILLGEMCRYSSASFARAARIQQEKYNGLGHVVDHFVNVVKSRFNCAPMVQDGQRGIFEFILAGVRVFCTILSLSFSFTSCLNHHRKPICSPLLVTYPSKLYRRKLVMILPTGTCSNATTL